MEVQFRRTGQRRYAVTVVRPGQTPLEMDPAPGYDTLMPHDLLHLVVELELGLRCGIFGQIAAGGTAGTFRPVSAPGQSDRAVSRQRRKLAKRGATLLREGRRESALSEGATYVCQQEWLARAAHRERGRRGPIRLPNGDPRAESEILTEERLDRICERLDALSARWASLEIGESLTVEWHSAFDRSAH
jgi:hypothetical protein